MPRRPVIGGDEPSGSATQAADAARRAHEDRGRIGRVDEDLADGAGR
jgi:hypothetical protein